MLSVKPISVVSGIIFIVAVASTASAQHSRADLDPRDGACFYQNPNYGGQWFCVRAGEALSSVPRGMNDQVSSIRTFGRYDVTVYQDQSFRGPAVRFDGDVPDLRRSKWNDRVSSIRVTGDRYGSRGGYDDRGGYYDRGGAYDHNDNANQMVRRAYRDVLGRDPDAEGMRHYRDRIVDDGWSEAQVRQDLGRRDEYRSGNSRRADTYGNARTRAQDIVRDAYRSVLNRDPDAGSAGYVERVIQDNWSQADVERELRRSAEYRNRVR